MGKKAKIYLLIVAILILAFQTVLILKDYEFPVLRPSGWVADQQQDLIIFTLLLSLVVVIPVFFMLFRFITKYSEKNTSAKYQPELDNNKVVETIWWTIPVLLIFILGIVTYKTSHSLDPFKPINSSKPTLQIQVVALQWKWLFIYPEQNVATINYVKLPVDRPVEFKITADAPMNSFWIPDLGGQIYAMSGMATELNLIANKPGEFKGVSANLSGEGFSKMRFIASAVGEVEFESWISQAQLKGEPFDHDMYHQLKKPSTVGQTIYRLEEPGLFDHLVYAHTGQDRGGY